MVSAGKSDLTGDLPFQVIVGPDGKSALAVVPLELLALLVEYAREAYAREGSAKASEDIRSWWADRETVTEYRIFPWPNQEQMEQSLTELQTLLKGHWESVVPPRHDEADEAEDIAAYDAAKRRNEDSFPLEVVDRQIAGGSPLKVFREYRGLTQSTLAKNVGTSAAYLSQIETGRRAGSVKLLRRLADALGVELDDLV